MLVSHRVWSHNDHSMMKAWRGITQTQCPCNKPIVSFVVDFYCFWCYDKNMKIKMFGKWTIEMAKPFRSCCYRVFTSSHPWKLKCEGCCYWWWFFLTLLLGHADVTFVTREDGGMFLALIGEWKWLRLRFLEFYALLLFFTLSLLPFVVSFLLLLIF